MRRKRDLFYWSKKASGKYSSFLAIGSRVYGEAHECLHARRGAALLGQAPRSFLEHCLHTAVSSQAPPEQAQSPRSLPACAHSKELLYKHRVHSWNRKDLRRVRAEADSLRKQKHAQIQPRSSGARQAELPLKSQRNRYQDVKQHYQFSRLPMSPGHFSSLRVTHIIQEPGKGTQ